MEAKELAKALEAKFKGRIRIRTADEFGHSYLLRRPTGVPSIDLATAGGLPAGSINQVFGPKGVGKDRLRWMIAAQVQKNYGNDARIAVCGFEYEPDKPFMNRNGFTVPMSKKEIDEYEKALGRPLTPEERASFTRRTGEVYILTSEDLEAPAESILQAVVELVDADQFQLVLIDGMGAYEPAVDVSKRLHDPRQVAAAPRLNTAFMRKLHMAFKNGNETTVVFSNQVRSDINAQRPGSYAVTGGHALEHGKAGDIHLHYLRPILEERDDHKVAIGKEIGWRIAKGKLGFHDGPAGVIYQYYDRGFDLVRDVLSLFLEHGAAVQSGAWIETWDGERFNGFEKTLIFLREHPEKVAEGLKLLYELQGVICRVR